MPINVFLSYSRTEGDPVEEIACRLDEAGLDIFLDKWSLVPGEPWQPELEEALLRSSVCVVFVGSEGLGNWQSAEMQIALNRQIANPGTAYRVIPVLLPGAERGARSQLPAFLTRNTWVEFPSLDDERALDRLIAGIRGDPPGPFRRRQGEARRSSSASDDTQCPYQGLRYFDVEDADRFFGREALTDWLVHELTKGPPLVGIIGPSGSGKSSLARAGVLAWMKAGQSDAGETWPQVVIRPGRDPLQSLAEGLSLGTESYDPSTVIEWARLLRAETSGLHLIAPKILGENPGGKIVLLVDQFEELFTHDVERAERDAFIDNLLYSVTAARSRFKVLLTLRADFYGHCAEHADFATVLADRHVLVEPMSRQELRSVIEHPAQHAGTTFEAGLVKELTEKIHGESSALPLLQFALEQLWNKREANVVTWAVYEEIGKIGGAIATRADELLLDLEQDETVVRQILGQLVNVGPDEANTRRRADREALEKLAPSAPGVIERLVSERLLTAHEAEIEIAHEALISEWGRLHSWIAEDREALQVHQLLGSALEAWRQGGRNPDDLWSGTRLGRILELGTSGAFSTPGPDQQTAARFDRSRVWGVLRREEADFVVRSLVRQRNQVPEDLLFRLGPEGVVALCNEYRSGDEESRLEGLRFASWLRGPFDRPAVDVLLRTLVEDEQERVAFRAGEILARTGRLDRLFAWMSERELAAETAKRIIRVLGYLRNLPDVAREVASLVLPKDRRSVELSAFRELVSASAGPLVATLAFALVAGRFANQLVTWIGRFLESAGGYEARGIPYGEMSVGLTLTFSLIAFWRASIDRRTVSTKTCLLVGVAAGLGSSSVYLIGSTFEEILRFSGLDSIRNIMSDYFRQLPEILAMWLLCHLLLRRTRARLSLRESMGIASAAGLIGTLTKVLITAPVSLLSWQPSDMIPWLETLKEKEFAFKTLDQWFTISVITGGCLLGAILATRWFDTLGFGEKARRRAPGLDSRAVPASPHVSNGSAGTAPRRAPWS